MQLPYLRPGVRLLLPSALWLMVVALSGCSAGDAEPAGLRTDSRAYAYDVDGSYADVLKRCVLVQSIADSCTLAELPVLGHSGTPTRDDIMQRVLLTHDWMGIRFGKLLEQLPDDLLHLFGATTAIYIGSYVRPSFYSTLNGAIHLDPDFLWLTEAEKATISREQDFRSSFGAELEFEAFRRFVRQQRYAWQFYPLDSNEERSYVDIRLSLARLLYHELAHANDFMPHTVWASLDSSLKFFDAVDSVRDQWVSAALSAEQPLNSSELKGLAKVRYRNDTPTEAEKSAAADYVGALMQADGANYFYGYFTEREDLAGIFEASMMKLHFAVDMDIAFVTKPEVDNPICADFLVGWGARGRLGNPHVAARARFITQRILSSASAVEALLDDLALEEQFMRVGDDWCDNLVLDTAADTTPQRIVPVVQPVGFHSEVDRMRD